MSDGPAGFPLAFDGADLLVRARPMPGSRELVITFTGRAAKPPATAGFGEEFFAKRGTSAIHFISKANHWWQTAELSVAIAAVRAQGLIGDERVTLYGSSMGGFAALIRSRELAADRIVTISPQFSIDAAKVPFELRWRNYAAGLAFEQDDMAAGLATAIPAWIIVDPLFRPDMAHVKLIAALRPVALLPVTLAGHNTARALEEMGLMQHVLQELIEDRFEASAWTQRYRAVRLRASLVWFGLAEALVARGGGAWAAAAVTIAAEMIVRGARMRDHGLQQQILRLAIQLAVERGDGAAAEGWLAALRAIEPKTHATALAAARLARLDPDPAVGLAAAAAARALRPEEPAIVAVWIDALVATGRTGEALSVGEVAIGKHKRNGAVQRAIAEAQAAAGDRAAAQHTAEQAIRRGLREPGLRILIAECCAAQGDPTAAGRAIGPVLHATLGGTADRARAAALGHRAGLDRLTDRFLERGERSDRLYRIAGGAARRLADGDPAASIAAILIRVAPERRSPHR